MEAANHALSPGWQSMKPASLSTMWLAGRFARLADFVPAGSKLGFSWFELNYQVTPEILGDVRPGQVPTSSVHYPCPRTLPEEAFGEEDIFFSSPDELRREQALELPESGMAPCFALTQTYSPPQPGLLPATCARSLRRVLAV